MIKSRLQLFFGSLIVIALLVWVGVFSGYKADSGKKNLQIYFLNVGQGDGEYIKTPSGQDILIDGGPDNSVLTELGKVMNFGDMKIDLVILTHPHADHIAGLVEVLKRYEVDEVWGSGVEYPSATYDTWKKLIIEKNIKNELVSVPKSADFGGAKITVLYPLLPEKNLKIDNVNNASVVTELDYGSFSALFTGDAEKSVQSEIYKNLHAVTVLKVNHHGSTNGTDDMWLQILRPAVAVIEVGAKNTFGHPTSTVIELLKKYAVQIYRTDQNDTINISSDGVNWWVKTGI